MKPESIVIPDEWMDYGPHDPLEARWFGRCRHCLERPALVPAERSAKGRAQWRARCACGATGEARDTPYEAAYRWNMSPAAVPLLRTELPFFQLASLSRHDAQQRLAILKPHLQARLKRASEERRQGTIIGIKYFHRLRSYVQWAFYSEYVLKRGLAPHPPAAPNPRS